MANLFMTIFFTTNFFTTKNGNSFLYFVYLLSFLGFSATYSSSVLAQTKYVTDKITLEIHETSSNTSALIEQVPSGTALTVLDTDGAFAKVETPDNKVGWVEAAYLMSNKPAQLLYSELADKHKQSLKLISTLQESVSKNNNSVPEPSDEDKKNISWMRVELKKARDKAKELKKTAVNSKQENTKSLEEKNRLENQISELQNKINETITENNKIINELNNLSSKISNNDSFFDNAESNGLNTEIPLLWFLLGMGVFMIVGVLAGMTMLDAHNRRRHGGFRI